jgi:hypothetical protein
MIALSIRSRYVQEDYVRDFIGNSGSQAVGYTVIIHSTRGCIGIYISRIELSLSEATKARAYIFHGGGRYHFRQLSADENLVYSRPATSFWVQLGLYFHVESDPSGRFQSWSLGIPDWIVAMMLAGGAILMWRKKSTLRYRRHHGLCLRCGYDVRATPDCCPECGAAVSSFSGRPGGARSFVPTQDVPLRGDR